MISQAELEIRSLADRYSDALNRRDTEAMSSFYTEDAVWECGEPINVRVEGKGALAKYNKEVLGLMDFLVQVVSSHVIEVEGDEATLRSTCHEVGRWADGSQGLDHYALYKSRLRKESDGKWRFAWRRFEILFTTGAVPVGTAYPPSI